MHHVTRRLSPSLIVAIVATLRGARDHLLRRGHMSVYKHDWKRVQAARAPAPRKPPSRTRLRRTLCATGLVAAMTALAAPAFAGVALNTIDRHAALDEAGRVVRVTGPIRCSQVERATIRVTVSQRTTGAVAEGQWRGRCRPTTRTWTVRRFVQHGSTTFETSTAQACALGVTRRGTKVTDAKRRCQTVRLAKRQ